MASRVCAEVSDRKDVFRQARRATAPYLILGSAHARV